MPTNLQCFRTDFCSWVYKGSSACSQWSKRAGSLLWYLLTWAPLHVILENVTPIKAQTDEVTQALAESGYSAMAVQVSPDTHGVPQTRNRVYIIASRVLTEEELKSISSILDLWKATTLFPFHMFLLPDDDELLTSELASRLRSRENANPTKGCQWLEHHDQQELKRMYGPE